MLYALGPSDNDKGKNIFYNKNITTYGNVTSHELSHRLCLSNSAHHRL